MHRKLQSFLFVVQNLVKGFHITANTVLHDAHILQNVVSSQILGIYNTSDVQSFNDIIKGNAVYLRNQFGIAVLFGKQGQQNVLSSRLVSVTKDSTRDSPFE